MCIPFTLINAIFIQLNSWLAIVSSTVVLLYKIKSVEIVLKLIMHLPFYRRMFVSMVYKALIEQTFKPPQMIIMDLFIVWMFCTSVSKAHL